ncbi:hypothetical protein A9P82_05155 [Arachidicoccus ginsenosidimutans]|nr:hypothetical protein A9P82_05155 [Arachidicoccus sp. BS20]
MYLFYALVLRRLTFYNHNRWYLLGYSVLCFFIPLINIASFSSVPRQSEATIMNTSVVRMIPNITFTGTPETHTVRAFDAEQLIVWIFFAGIVIMLLRLLFQLFSYKKLARSAKIISDENAVKLYQIDEEIVPFSFGNSIFINRDLHDENALREILQHEFVHVKQKHTLDILWGEILCIINWYNPFVWLIRKAIRENLEFIADDKVVQSGINKQQYQYLLLRVMGNNNFSITNNFNFSSLKKRIAMMNKIKTAKIHLLKFLFLIPLLGILLVSFRDVIKTSRNAGTITVSGIVVNENLQPLSNVSVEDNINHAKVMTDKNGYYSFKIQPNKNDKYKTLLKFTKTGFENFTTSSYLPSIKNGFIVANIGLRKLNVINANGSVFPFASWGKDYNHSISYNEMLQQLKHSVDEFKKDDKMDKIETSEDSLEKLEDSIEKKNNNKGIITVSRQINLAGLVVDAETKTGIAFAKIYDNKNHFLGESDKNGYFKISIDYNKEGEIQFALNLSASGYKKFRDKEHWGDLRNPKTCIYFGLQKIGSHAEAFSQLGNNDDLNYETVSTEFSNLKKEIDAQDLLKEKIAKAQKGNENVLINIGNDLYLTDNSGWIKINSLNDVIAVNENQYVTADQINSVIKRKDIKFMSPLDKGLKAQYEIDTKKIKDNGKHKSAVNRNDSLVFVEGSLLVFNSDNKNKSKPDITITADTIVLKNHKF